MKYFTNKSNKKFQRLIIRIRCENIISNNKYWLKNIISIDWKKRIENINWINWIISIVNRRLWKYKKNWIYINWNK